MFLCSLVAWIFGLTASQYFPFRDPTLPLAERVDDLVARLTLEEIVPQTLAVYGSHTPAIPRLGIQPYVWISECLRGQVNTNTTAFPQSLGLAATFSKSLIHDIAEAISYEVRAHWNGNRKRGMYNTMYGLSCFSPVINIMRHPLWGRNQETYGECPFLSGSLVQGYVKGLQGDGKYIRANAGCKHFDVHGGPENIPVDRSSFNAKVSMRDWRMTFLPQFRMCVEAGSRSLMCSYNAINGVPACANWGLLTQVTRREWGFDGYIVSDAGAISNIISQHHYMNNSVDTAAAAIIAGCNLELGSDVYKSQLDALKAGKLAEDEIRRNVRPLMETRMRLGEFDPEDMNPYNKIDYSVIQSQAHRDLALKAAKSSFVLMKNLNDLLPLKKKFSSIAVVGPMANNSDQQTGDYSSTVMAQFTSTPLEGLAPLADRVQHAAGCDDNKCTKYSASAVQAAVSGAGLVVVCVGNGQQLESEGNDRATLSLPGKQAQLVDDAVKAANGAPVVLVLFTAGPVDIRAAKANPAIGAILQVFYPAQSTGRALYEVMVVAGVTDNVPAGRLPATWPTDLNQIPPITDYTMEGRTYRYYKGDPLYPFGYGLSYSKFEYSDLVVPQKVSQGSDFQVKVTVTNKGPYDADEVIQLYMSWPQTSVPVPGLQLVGFERVPLIVGRAVTVEFTVTARSLAIWMDNSRGWTIITGEYSLSAGGQQPHQATAAPSNVLMANFTVLAGQL